MAQQFDSDGRGLFSCLYSKCDDASLPEDTRQAVCDLIIDLYEEAFARMPITDIAADGAVDMVRLIKDGGDCLGLLDPVSNIILNAASILPPGFASSSSASSTPAHPRSTWNVLAWRSYNGLIDFMMGYFGCLSKEQATRYLRWAGADLALAVLLVEHDLFAAEPAPPDPGSERTQAALKHALVKTHHPAPDILVRLAASRLPRARLEAVVGPVLLGSGRKLTVDELAAIADLARDLEKPACHASMMLLPHGEGAIVSIERLTIDGVVTRTTSDPGDGYTTTTTTTVRRVGCHIASLRSAMHMDSMLSTCLTQAADAQQRSRLKLSCRNPSDCEYLQSLEMRLLDTIRSFYLKALSLVPLDSGHLIRSILVAGHCYGSMDPVSNIILNSIWYDRFYPLPKADFCEIQSYDVLDALFMLRTQVHSLQGLLAFVRAEDYESGVRTLCSINCEVSNMLPAGVILKSWFRSRDNPYMAIRAANQPLLHGLALLHTRLLVAPKELNQLRSVMSANSVLSLDVFNYIAALVDEVFKINPEVEKNLHVRAPELCQEAMSTLSRKRLEHKHKSTFIRSKLAQLLKEYVSQHSWEPKYVLNFICGVEESGPLYTERFQVNFMAASELQPNTLFFAEFWVSNHDKSKPNFCCPLPPPYTGRCYCGERSARKIVYPSSSTANFMFDITAGGTKDADKMLDTDFVYFDSQRDMKFASEVNSYYASGVQEQSRPSVLRSRMLSP